MRMTKRQADAVNQIIQEEAAAEKTARSRASEHLELGDMFENDVDFPPLNEGSVLSEEYLHGVPEWQLREDTTNFVNMIRKRIKTFILLNKSENQADQREAIDAMNDVCDQLEEKVYDLLEDGLFNFTRRV